MSPSLTNLRSRAGVSARLESLLDRTPAPALEPFTWTELKTPLAIFAASRVYVLFILLAVTKVLNYPLTHLLGGWDSKWYVSIAQQGYVSSVPPGHGDPAQCNLGFFPFLPVLIRTVHTLSPFDWLVSGVIATTITGFTASIAIWLLLRSRFAIAPSTRAVALALFAPGAFVLSLVYSEGLIITFACLTLLALQRRHWIAAGLFAALTSLADPVGVAAVFACVLTAVVAIKKERNTEPLTAVIVAPLGIIGFFTYLYFHTGDFFSWFIAQRTGWQGGYYFNGIPRAFYEFAVYGFSSFNSAIKAISVLVALLLVWLLVKTRPALSLMAYAGFVFFLGALSPVIAITPRLLLRNTPLVATLGAQLTKKTYYVFLAISIGCLGFLTIVSSSPRWTP